jgi:3-hydroxybutyryl-CoA dehydrogenase
MRFDTSQTVGVIGAGAMGAGIAQVAAMPGIRCCSPMRAGGDCARPRGHTKAMAREVEKGRLTRDEATRCSRASPM